MYASTIKCSFELKHGLQLDGATYMDWTGECDEPAQSFDPMLHNAMIWTSKANGSSQK